MVKHRLGLSCEMHRIGGICAGARRAVTDPSESIADVEFQMRQDRITLDRLRECGCLLATWVLERLHLARI